MDTDESPSYSNLSIMGVWREGWRDGWRDGNTERREGKKLKLPSFSDQ